VHEHDQRSRIRPGGQVQVEQQRAEPERGGVRQPADEPNVVTGGGVCVMAAVLSSSESRFHRL
jgi:hypothetical protein